MIKVDLIEFNLKLMKGLKYPPLAYFQIVVLVHCIDGDFL
jgi:hypothetical protein